MTRLAAIQRLELIGELGNPAATALTRLACHITGAGAAAVHILDAEKQHRVAATGAPLGEHPVQDSMCRLVVEGEQRIVCADASTDPRFSYSSFVQGDSPVRFYASLPIRLADGSVVGTVCAFDERALELSDEQIARLDDLAAQADMQVELLQVATDLGEAAAHDPLTGAVNRTIFEDRLGQALARRARRPTVVHVIVLDVDNFKRVNDEHGHAWGDEVLRSLVARIRAATRAEDTVCRLGGDEFAVVMETDEHEPVEPILTRIRDALFVADVRDLPSVSLGWIVANPHDDVRTAVARADAAMYAAKRSRR